MTAPQMTGDQLAGGVAGIPPRRLALGIGALLIIAATQWWAIATSPPDRDMGNLEKILYVHVPGAWMSFVAFLAVFIASVMYLWKRDEKSDLLAASAAEVGAVFTAMTLMLGSIWARPTWGTWWTWDARLTSYAILLIIFIGYLTLRASTDDVERRARWSAAVGILGAINVPIVYFSVRMWRTIHQPQSSPETLAAPYKNGLRINALAMMLVLIWLIVVRYRAARLDRATEMLVESAALSGRAKS